MALQPDLQTFFEQPALQLAPALLGCELVVTDEAGQKAGGIIVETEAYGQEDEASHCFKGQTKRNAAMFDAGGALYVYFTYGMHLCVNIVSGQKGHGEGVLIRALEPTVGSELMWQRRFKHELPAEPPRAKTIQLTNGPAKLAQALGISLTDNHVRINTTSRCSLRLPHQPYSKNAIVQTTRVGISKAINEPWRWYVKGSAFVSKG